MFRGFFRLPSPRSRFKHDAIMKSLSAALFFDALLALGLLLRPTPARAELRQFTVDPTQSSLTISGTFSSFDITPQAPGSLTTSYTGIIEAEVTGANVLFWGGSVIAARTNGNWEPGPGGVAGTAPGDYGGQVVNFFVNGKAALRNVLFDVTSDLLPVNAGGFDSLGLRFNFVPAFNSVIDFAYSLTFGNPGSGSQVLTGTSTNGASTNATLVLQGEDMVLVIPVDITGSVSVANPNDVQYRFRGQLVAKSAATTPLQIHSFQITTGQLSFNISTVPGQAYTILGSTNLIDWLAVVDQFTATNTLTERIVIQPAWLPHQYFRVRQD